MRVINRESDEQDAVGSSSTRHERREKAKSEETLNLFGLYSVKVLRKWHQVSSYFQDVLPRYECANVGVKLSLRHGCTPLRDVIHTANTAQSIAFVRWADTSQRS